MTQPTLHKYRTLTHLLDTLGEAFNAGLLEVDERWRDNEEALGLFMPGDHSLSAFIYTYGQPVGRYAVELSFPDEGDALTSGEPLVREELSLARLLGVLRAHFGLPEPA
ncbi:hypothetical protein GO613_14620 [Azoarcus communis]|uniref:Uncharacterized protein n=1 Tax=Parazoarcus communis SWub3 = DSM 12120 TaxID=1121029 RepID=A0A323UY29_9RHOO|nr:hypothetical protein [Parazoarcus communis]NMG49328.1 hypothetical protein [Parazoarcus communis]NMG69406.1 hypothetical protein [Parazoarcus communis SWub3 = DSM 12120]PZA17354.1 hypothetical protein DNK49_05680 [Azoarcus communis] [Parazoarcus communis SWub3 = DSM 12120]